MTRGKRSPPTDVSAPLKPKSARPAKKRAATRAKAKAKAPEVKYEKRFAALARKMVLAKIDEDEIADFFGVDTEQLEWWKEEHHEFHEAFRPDQRNLGGRPTLWDPKFLTIAETLASLGATDLEIAQAFEVSIRTIHRWKLEHPEFREALKLGKEEADAKVEDSLFKRATGYSFDSEKILVIDGEPQRVETIEHVPPDTRAAMWWLQNRNPEKWRDVRHIKHDVDKGGTLENWLNNLNGSVPKPVEEEAQAQNPTASLIADDED